MWHSDNAAVRMPELVMAAFGMNRIKALDLEPFDNVGTVHDVYLYTLQRVLSSKVLGYPLSL